MLVFLSIFLNYCHDLLDQQSYQGKDNVLVCNHERQMSKRCEGPFSPVKALEMTSPIMTTVYDNEKAQNRYV